MDRHSAARTGDDRELARRRQEELEHVNEILVQRGDNLSRQVEELAKTNADLRHFVSLAWHDLQEPLRAIGIYAQLLKHRYQARIDEDADRILGTISDGVRRMDTLIRALMAYARAGSPEAVSDFQSANAADALRSAIANLGLMVEESGAVVDWDPLPTVDYPGDQLTQVFQNLLSNAIKYRGPEPPRVHVSAQLKNGEYLFSVADNGVGIAVHHQEAIFHPFKRLHGSEYPGTGVGLALCRRIVERNGGHIWVESEPGKGATFRFSIPIVKRTSGHADLLQTARSALA